MPTTVMMMLVAAGTMTMKIRLLHQNHRNGKRVTTRNQSKQPAEAKARPQQQYKKRSIPRLSSQEEVEEVDQGRRLPSYPIHPNSGTITMHQHRKNNSNSNRCQRPNQQDQQQQRLNLPRRWGQRLRLVARLDGNRKR
jgi:hypothetical protein